jgi:hypothetical protein
LLSYICPTKIVGNRSKIVKSSKQLKDIAIKVLILNFKDNQRFSRPFTEGEKWHSMAESSPCYSFILP